MNIQRILGPWTEDQARAVRDACSEELDAGVELTHNGTLWYVIVETNATDAGLLGFARGVAWRK